MLDAGTAPAARGRLLRPERVPHLTDVRRHQLAGPLHAAVRAVGRQPAALRPAGRERPPHPEPAPSSGPAGGPSPTCPSNEQDWPEGDVVLRLRPDLRRHATSATPGPQFSYATMPDQYTLSAFQRLELAQPDRPPVMAEIDLVSSHTPWAPLPQHGRLGRGRRRLGLRRHARAGAVAGATCGATPSTVRAAYGQSIRVLAEQR